MKLQQLYSYVRKAVDEYHMIGEGDRIAVGISGGKDSLTLLYALAGLRRFYPKQFELEAVSVHLGFPDLDLSPVGILCEELQVPFTVVPTEIGPIVFDARKETNPCSLCAKMRKGSFNERVKELGCNKVALAHHRDDIIETMLMSLIFEGRFHTFSPVTYLDRTELTVIRPLMFVDESEVKAFRSLYHLPVCKNPCPAEGHTKRQYAKELVASLNEDHPGAKDRMFTAILDGNISGWPERFPYQRTRSATTAEAAASTEGREHKVEANTIWPPEQ